MKYTNSIYTPNLSGKEGNTVFSKNMYGPYSCEKKLPVDPQTPDQLKVRQGTSSISRAWSAVLSQLQRDNWDLTAKSVPFLKEGKTYFLSGFMLFMKYNRNLYEINEPLLKDSPVNNKFEPQSLSKFSVRLIETNSGTDLLMFFKPAINDNTKIILSATKPVKNSEKYGTHKLHKIAVLDSTFKVGSSIKKYYTKKYLVLPNSFQKAYFDIRAVDIRSGISSSILSSQVNGI